MDALDEQLAQLKLINSRSLSPKPLTSRQNTTKKVGPAVPPKPLKKNVPQVPHSSVVKQTCEPLYSTRLQAEEVTQKQTGLLGAQKKGTSSHQLINMTLTLDNSTILNQQLEALEYHKNQLEKEGILPIQNPTSSAASKFSNSAAYMNVGNGKVASNFPQQSSRVYANLSSPSAKEKDNGVVYSNIIHHSNVPDKAANNIVYSNVGFGNTADELPPPPPLDVPTMNMTDTTFEYLNQTSEDELPPPPSPVSSSYSELRRATDNFPQMPSYPISAPYNSGGSANTANVQIAMHPATGGQQTYANTSFQNVYSTYEPSSQSISQNSSDYYGCGSFSQGSSTYESIYEPINPRPPSQLSSRSNYSLYTSYVNGPQSDSSTTPVNTTGPNRTNGSNGGKLSSCKEAEVEVLTDLLVQSMDGEQDGDNFGICVKCGEHVVGESSGCTAMEQIYHIKCFTCSQCQINLQGKPFYALEGKPYCEEDYLNTLEKCSVCMEPILERILRATGKPYHPGCFCCVVCGKSLDGIPFTVDATNQNYCIEDFHKKFAPRCCVCREPIMPEPGQEETVRVVALDRSFHFECYKCEDCGLLLSSEADGRGCYPLDDHVLCKSCNARRVQALTNRMTTEL